MANPTTKTKTNAKKKTKLVSDKLAVQVDVLEKKVAYLESKAIEDLKDIIDEHEQEKRRLIAKQKSEQRSAAIEIIMYIVVFGVMALATYLSTKGERRRYT